MTPTTVQFEASPDFPSDRRLVLVSLDWTRDKDPRVPLAQASLLAAAKEAGVGVTGLSYPVNHEDFSTRQILEDILNIIPPTDDSRYDIGFGAYVWNEQYIQQLCPEIRRKRPQARIVMGGPQISYSGPGLEERYPFADAFLRGYGESALVDLVASEDRRDIPGIHWSGDGVDPQKQAKVNLDELPSPFLNGIVDVERQDFIRWETKRGCQFNCSFCQHREAGKKLRRRELERDRLLDEVRLFCAHDVRDIAVLDPIFNRGDDHMAILEAFQRHGFDGKLSLQCRFEFVEEAFLDLAADLNCTLEFGLQTIHRHEGEAVGRPNHMPKVEQAVDQLHRRGIDFEVSLIFGLPFQTLASFEESIAWCLQHRVPTVKAFPLMLLRGTELEQRRNEWGLIENDDPIPSVVASDTYDRADWERMNALSKALSETEGDHPADIIGLRRIADFFNPHTRRWSPAVLPEDSLQGRSPSGKPGVL